MSVEDNGKICGVGYCVTGKIEAGQFNIGMKVKIFPSGRETTIKKICYGPDEKDDYSEAQAGAVVGINVTGLHYRMDIKRN